MKTKYCITFGGAVGGSKSPIAYYLSWNLGLPIYNNDAIRTEVTEDSNYFDQEEYMRRRDQRIQTLVKIGKPFIYDASIDREWAKLKIFQENGYQLFIISLDLSKSFLEYLYKAKQYQESLGRLYQLIEDHDAFLKANKERVNVHIQDQDFPNRLDLSLTAVRE